MENVKNILVVRTDRIGEVLLTTPVLTALKEKWPQAEITMMVKPEVRELIEGNPNVSEIMEYSESEAAGAVKLAIILRKKEFDIAVIANPKKEFHLAAFLAGIPVRVGFNRKLGFLLTHKVKDLKSLAQRHEVEYNLDLVRVLGVEPKDTKPVLIVGDYAKIPDMPRNLIAIHPCTSNPMKQWPKAYFAKLGDLLMENGYNTVIVSGVKELPYAKEVIGMMKQKPFDLAGKLTLKALAALLKRCEFLVSCDSGPVHIAAAVETPVVALFGSKDPGSNPTRWGPYGNGHVIIQKDKIGDISPQEVFKAIKYAHTDN